MRNFVLQSYDGSFEVFQNPERKTPEQIRLEDLEKRVDVLVRKISQLERRETA